MATPFVLGPATAVATGVSFRTARRDIADELGEWAPMLVASTPTTATTPDAARQILCTALGSDGQMVSRFDGFYVYVVDGAQAGEVRQVLSGTYDGGISSLLVDLPFSAPLAAGTEIELSNPLPASRHLTVKGIRECINEGLERCVIDTRLSVVGTGSQSISLSGYPYVTLSAQVDSVWQRSSSTNPYLLGSNDARVVQDGADLTLVTDVAIPSGETFQIRMLRRADTLIKTSGIWGTSTTGLVSDTDETAAPYHWIRAFGLRQALKVCILQTQRDQRLSAEERRERISGEGGYAQRQRQWTKAAKRIILLEFPRATPRRMAGLISGFTVNDHSNADVSGWP